MLVVVGRIGRAHGLRGEVGVEVRTDEPETRFAVGSVVLTDPQRAGSGVSKGKPVPATLEVATTRWHSGRLLVRFAGYADRTAAESLQGLLLSVEVDPSDVPDDADEFYDVELIGMAVVDQTGQALGEVADVLHLPGQDVLAVRRPAGDEALVPFVTEIVPSIDRATRTVVVNDPGGLFDDAEAE